MIMITKILMICCKVISIIVKTTQSDFCLKYKLLMETLLPGIALDLKFISSSRTIRGKLNFNKYKKRYIIFKKLVTIRFVGYIGRTSSDGNNTQCTTFKKNVLIFLVFSTLCIGCCFYLIKFAWCNGWNVMLQVFLQKIYNAFGCIC